LAKSGESLSQRVVRGGIWVFALRITERGFSLIRLVILARILAPHDFGLMGIALLTMATLDTFSQTGFHAALIQKKDNIDSYLNAAWTVLILRGFILFTILFFIAPYAAIFFKVPQAKAIIQVIGLSVLLQGFTNIGVIYFQKELEFNKQFLYQLSGTLADFIVAVSAALILRSAWALVFGLLAGNVARFIASYLIHPHRPRLSSDLGKVRELWVFGRWVLGSSILIFLITQGDDIFVGKLLGATMLGFYQMAYRISNMPATEITHVISQVTFPAYSKLQDNLPKLREAYLKTLQLAAFLSFPIAGMTFMLAPDFTKIFLGEKWMPMVPAMQMLCVFGVTRSLGATTGPLFQGVGKPNILTQLAVIQLILMVAIIYPLTSKLGIYGTAIAILIPNLITQLIAGIQTLRVLSIMKNDSRLIQSVLFPLISVSGMTLFLLILSHIWKNVNIYIFSLLILFGMTSYLGILYLFRRKSGYDVMRTLFQLLRQN